MKDAQEALTGLLESDELTRGMYVRPHGEHLCVGRPDTERGAGSDEADDRIRLTRRSRTTWGLSVKRHTGRWERTPFTGTMREVVDAIWTFMQHLVAPD